MRLLGHLSALLLTIAVLFGCQENTTAVISSFQLTNTRVGGYTLLAGQSNSGAPTDQSINLTFSTAVDPSSVPGSIKLRKKNTDYVGLAFDYLDNGRTVSITTTLVSNQAYELAISEQLKGAKGETFLGVNISFVTQALPLSLTGLKFGGKEFLNAALIKDVDLNVPVDITFSNAIDLTTANTQNVRLLGPKGLVPSTIAVSSDNKRVTISPLTPMSHLSRHQLLISGSITGVNGEVFTTYLRNFYTKVDPTPKYPIISDDALLTLTQRQTFKYFYDFAHPASGMARERNSSGDLVTLGGSGFGVMALIVGIERGFITRSQGLDRLNKVITFLETSDRFHGAWPHWINGNTGKTIPFSANDNGADLVETAFMVQGLITVRQYLNGAVSEEQSLKDRINVLCEAVDWNWFTRGNQNVLYWHWSLDKGWAMNMQINGYNEALIVYTLAATSTTYTISPAVYNNGWARNGAMRNNKLFYNIKLPLGYDFGGPLFFAHYSFLGLNPKSLSDQYANYWEQNVNHTLINRAYCIANPKNFVSYSDQNWGLTASDNQSGYSAHSPTNDLGVISPTAALSSMPYTPTESMDALKFFYYTMGDQLWGDYGFYDAFNVTEGWIANSYLAIDQGPIIIMIENHRSALLWNLFMSAPEVKDGLTKLGFSY
ncbi:MAG: Ig-like domain-containing protein [Chryseotalea sp. WA131a]|nr:MAG: Ig-like domain-containing protein [Chryseotalea sp. WA131a]